MCCTFDMKNCLVSIRKNGKDVADSFDQDGDQNKRKNELHSLKDILMRESDKQTRDMADPRVQVDAGLAQIQGTVKQEVKSCCELAAHTEEDLVETMQRDKKELRDKIESESSDVKRRLLSRSSRVRASRRTPTRR